MKQLGLISAASAGVRHFIMRLLLQHFELRKLVSFRLAHIVLRGRTQCAVQYSVHRLTGGLYDTTFGSIMPGGIPLLLSTLLLLLLFHLLVHLFLLRLLR